jgi:hypothetical protein
MSSPATTSTATPTADTGSGEGSEPAERWWDDEGGSEGEDHEEDRRAREVDEWLASDADDDADDDDESEESEREPEKKAAKPKEAEKKETQGKEAKPAKKTPPAAEESAEPTTYKVKLGKEERELDVAKMARALGTTPEVLERINPEAAVRMYQKQWLAEVRQSESTQAIKQFENFLENIKGDPLTAIQRLLSDKRLGGHDFEKLATDYLARRFEEQSLPEGERNYRRAQRELEGLKAQQAAQQRQAEQEREQQRRRAWAQQLGQEITDALTGAGYGTDPRMRSRIVALMQREKAERGDDDDTPLSRAVDLIPALESELDADIEVRLKKLGAKGFEKRYPELAKEISELRVAKFKQHSQAQRAPREDSPDPTPRRESKPQRPLTFKEARARMQKKLR